MIRYLTAGESHGKSITVIVEGFPSGLSVSLEKINKDLQRRQGGYGRGERMKIEKDHVEVTSGIRHGKTLGTPITMVIFNKDWENWKEIMAVDLPVEMRSQAITRPRPGHLDLAGALKYNQKDLRNVMERSSARETVGRVLAGSLAKQLLQQFQIEIFSHVIEIGGIKAELKEKLGEESYEKILKSPVYCADEKAELEMLKKIDLAKEKGDSLGGIFEVVVIGLPPGLGNPYHWDRRLDGRLAKAVMSIQAIKGVEIGLGLEASRLFGSQVHDVIYYEEIAPRKGRFHRKTNHAGGLEGGISNGEELILRGAMKPIPTLRSPIMSADINTKEPKEAVVERADVCAVPAVSVIAEAAVAWELADCFLEKFGGDSLEEIKSNYERYLKYLEEF